MSGARFAMGMRTAPGHANARGNVRMKGAGQRPGAVPTGLIVAVILGSCGAPGPPPQESARTAGETTASAAEDPDQAGAGYRETTVTAGGSIQGMVRYSGAAPPPRPATEDMRECGVTRAIEAVAVGAEGGLANAVAALRDIRAGSALSVLPERVVIDQADCEFRPRVQVVRTDGVVAFTNSDPVAHNIRTSSFGNRPVNRTQPRGAPAVELGFRVPDRVQVRCDMHPWMTAILIVVDHPYHAVTDRDGEFVLTDVPAGTHTLEIWHESVGAKTYAVEVAAGETVRFDVDLAAPQSP